MFAFQAVDAGGIPIGSDVMVNTVQEGTVSKTYEMAVNPPPGGSAQPTKTTGERHVTYTMTDSVQQATVTQPEPVKRTRSLMQRWAEGADVTVSDLSTSESTSKSSGSKEGASANVAATSEATKEPSPNPLVTILGTMQSPRSPYRPSIVANKPGKSSASSSAVQEAKRKADEGRKKAGKKTSGHRHKKK